MMKHSTHDFFTPLGTRVPLTAFVWDLAVHHLLRDCEHLISIHHLSAGHYTCNLRMGIFPTSVTPLPSPALMKASCIALLRLDHGIN